MDQLSNDDEDGAKRHKFVTALVALVEHIGNLGPEHHTSKTDNLVMNLVDAAEITHEEFQAAQAELRGETKPRTGMQ